MTVLDRVDHMYRTYGIWVSTQVSIRRDSPSGANDIDQAMSLLRSEPPSTLGGVQVEGVMDFLIGADERPSYLGSSNLIELDLGEMGRVLARPSGTEPKLKIYVDLTGSYPDDGTWQAAESALKAQANVVGEDLASWLTETMTVS
jgi:phosphomannomutase